MPTTHHVRLLAAMLLALGVHGVIFYCSTLINPAHQQAATAALMVSLLPNSDTNSDTKADTHENADAADQPLPSPPAKVAHTTPTNLLSNPSPKQAKQQPIHTSLPAKPHTRQTSIPSRPSAEPSTTTLASNALPSTTHGLHEVIIVPDILQTQILAQVHYPNRARRRGWQGDTTLEFSIQQQAVQHITLAESSGFDALDQAAFEALTSLASLPLSDGRYRLPVIFRLQ